VGHSIPFPGVISCRWEKFEVDMFDILELIQLIQAPIPIRKNLKWMDYLIGLKPTGA
jgi:hypothetical protein